jgi:type IV pilus assembly protein PilE
MSDRGFTLIELMIVLVIAGILASIAYPSYAAYVTRARRVEAQAYLMDLLQAQERHFNRHTTYLAYSADDQSEESEMHWWHGPSPADSAYEFSARACEGYTLQQCVLVRATPGTDRVSRSFSDPECGTLEASSLGERTASGPQRRCWP